MKRLLLLALLAGCADKHALQMTVTCQYPSTPRFNARTGILLADFYLLPDGGVEMR